MSTKENKELTRSAFEEFDACRQDLAKLRVWLIKFCAPEFVFHHASGINYSGEQMIQMTCEGQAAFPDFHSVINDMITEEDKVVICFTSRGSQKGPYMGVPPTGKEFITRGVEIYRIAGLKIVEQWNVQDDLGGLIPLGLLSFAPYDQSRDNKLMQIKPFGILVYTPLTLKLEGINDLDERRRMATRELPVALLCASQNDQCLVDIKNVGTAFPDLLPVIFKCAMELRSDKRFGNWTKYESDNYREFIASIVK
jgi:predicted ester cyclase